MQYKCHVSRYTMEFKKQSPEKQFCIMFSTDTVFLFVGNVFDPWWIEWLVVYPQMQRAGCVPGQKGKIEWCRCLFYSADLKSIANSVQLVYNIVSYDAAWYVNGITIVTEMPSLPSLKFKRSIRYL